MNDQVRGLTYVVGGCFFGHRWSRWETIKTYALLNLKNERCGAGLLQQRECEVCGKKELNSQRALV